MSNRSNTDWKKLQRCRYWTEKKQCLGVRNENKTKNEYVNISYLKITELPAKSAGARHVSEIVFFGTALECVAEFPVPLGQFINRTSGTGLTYWPTIRFRLWLFRAWMMKPRNGMLCVRIWIVIVWPRLTVVAEGTKVNGLRPVSGGGRWPGIIDSHAVVGAPVGFPMLNWIVNADKYRQINVMYCIVRVETGVFGIKKTAWVIEEALGFGLVSRMK